MATKIICDLCGCENQTNKTILPTHTYRKIRGGFQDRVVGEYYNGVQPTELDVCNSCKIKLADLISDMQDNMRTTSSVTKDTNKTKRELNEI